MKFEIDRAFALSPNTVQSQKVSNSKAECRRDCLPKDYKMTLRFLWCSALFYFCFFSSLLFIFLKELLLPRRAARLDQPDSFYQQSVASRREVWQELLFSERTLTSPRTPAGALSVHSHVVSLAASFAVFIGCHICPDKGLTGALCAGRQWVTVGKATLHTF